MAGPSIPLITAPLAVVLINPVTGNAYRAGQADATNPVVRAANFTSPLGGVLVDPTTGNPYVG